MYSKIVAYCLFLCFITVQSLSKYSKEVNINLQEHFMDEPDIEVRHIEKPFRMAKLNLLWTKAKVRLSEPKLKSLYTDLKLQDKEEVALKHLKASKGDETGLKEAEVRRKLIGIMSSYDLLQHFKDTEDVKKLKDYDTSPENYMNKNVFKDKKLSKLWMKAEMAGFNSLELQVLKEEFSHHQDKLDQYHSVLKEMEVEERNVAENAVEDKLEKFNTIEDLEESQQSKDFHGRMNEIRTKGREIKDSYDRLERLAAQGPNSKEFVEPKVQNLWKVAVNSNFSQDELQSLRTELHHYEKRLLKLRNLHIEAAIGKSEESKKLTGEKADEEEMQELINKQSRKVEKLHNDLESKILSRSEL